MDIKAYQLMIQNQAMATMTANQDSFSYHSPMLDLSFKQLLQDKINQASGLNGQLGQALGVSHTYAPAVFQQAQAISAEPNIPSTEFNSIITEMAQKYGIDEKLIHAVIKMESNYHPMAKSH